MRYGSCAGCSILLCEEFTLFHAEILTSEAREHQQMIVETTCCVRENVRKR